MHEEEQHPRPIRISDSEQHSPRSRFRHEIQISGSILDEKNRDGEKQRNFLCIILTSFKRAAFAAR